MVMGGGSYIAFPCKTRSLFHRNALEIAPNVKVLMNFFFPFCVLKKTLEKNFVSLKINDKNPH